MMNKKYIQALKRESGILLSLGISLLSPYTNASEKVDGDLESGRLKHARFHNEIALKHGFHDRLLDLEAIKEREKQPKQKGVAQVFVEEAEGLKSRTQKQNEEKDQGFKLCFEAGQDYLEEGKLKPKTKGNILKFLAECLLGSDND